MNQPVGQLCWNHGVALVDALPPDLAALNLDSPAVQADDTAEEFARTLHQGTYFSYVQNSSHPHTMHCTNARDRLRVFLEGADLLGAPFLGNRHIPARLWEMTQALYAVLKGDEPVDFLVNEILAYLELLGNFKLATKLWGATRPVVTHSKAVAAAKQHPQFNLMTGYATPTTLRKLAGQFDPSLIVQTFGVDKDNPVAHPLGHWSTASTPNNPRIIYDDGAAFCTPVLAFAADGTAIHFHDALVQYDWFSNLKGKLPWTLAPFVQHVREQLPADVAVCIGGGNLYGEDDAIGDVVRGVKHCLNPQLFINFTQKTSPKQTDFGFQYGIFNKCRGFIFIPKQLSVIGMNQLLIVDEDASIVFRHGIGPDRIIWT